jgi:uncharacterized membrane protein
MIRQKLIAAFFIFHIFDKISTYIAVDKLGFVEINPFANFLFETYGMLAGFTLKALIISAAVVLYLYLVQYRSGFKKSFEFALEVSTIVTFIAVVINFTGIAAEIRNISMIN